MQLYSYQVINYLTKQNQHVDSEKKENRVSLHIFIIFSQFLPRNSFLASLETGFVTTITIIPSFERFFKKYL